MLRGDIRPLGSAGVKGAGDYYRNYEAGLPSELLLLNLFDPKTGAPVAVIDASDITDMRTGAVTAIGVAILNRSALPPAVPTVAEQGMARFEAVSWYALMVPAGTPRDVIERLNVETSRLVARPELREKLSVGGLDGASSKAQELSTTIQSQSARWADVIKRRGNKPE